MTRLYTLGHSTRTIEEFMGLLCHYGIKTLVDIRTVPRSRHNPQYDQSVFMATLTEAGIHYIYLKGLGGLRPKTDSDVNLGWRNASFRNYADYMQTADFDKALGELIKIAELETAVILCAEAVPWRCHHSLVADALLIRGVEVIDIMDERHANPHKLTSFAKVDGFKITYPPEKSNEPEN